MKLTKRVSAVELRKKGFSINHIAERLDVSKSSVSLWVRAIELGDSQISKLNAAPYTSQAVEKRRLSRLKNAEEKRAKTISSAKAEITSLTFNDLWLIGIMLYWAEGGKTQRMVRFSNGDPNMHLIMMKFFRIVCEVPEEKFRGYIHIHEHLDHEAAEEYWSEIVKVPNNQFFKTYRKSSIKYTGKKDSLPYGVLDVYVLDTSLFLRLKGWAAAVFSASISH